MKKIGLMTWFSYKNYGTVLQAYALQKVIKDQGYQCDLIKYYPRSGYINKQTFSFLIKRIVKKSISIINTSKDSYKNHSLFDKFINDNFSFTDYCTCHSELKLLNEKYDCFVCGSDQIWSEANFNRDYFLSFAESNKRISYAPSFGISKLSNCELAEEIAEEIKKFRYLSVREETGKNIIKNLTGLNAKVVLDPTLLLTIDEWSKLIENDLIIEDKYILCYFLGNPNRYVHNVRRISKKNKLPVYLITNNVICDPIYNKIKKNIGPNEFLSLFKNASFVCTDSFHGMIFSINFNIPFYVYRRFNDRNRESQNSRIYDFLNMMNLSERLISPSSCNDLLLDLDYKSINTKLNILRKESMIYIKSSISNVVEEVKLNIPFNFTITENCCGCGACKTICPHRAIEIKQNPEGFYNYVINEKLCVRCKKCLSACPFNNIDAEKIDDAVSLYAMSSNNSKILLNSSSGGIATELAINSLKGGKWVAGAWYDTNNDSVEHILVSDLNDVNKIQGSKYLQSYTANIFRIILNELSNNKEGLFIGTPCQVAGLDRLLKMYGYRDRVILVDLICHGVPSYKLWSKYLSEFNLEDNHKVFFRYPSYSKRRKIALIDSHKQVINDEFKDDFYAIFKRSLCDSKCCYECPYRSKSSADIRLGDYWGEKYSNVRSGVSMVLTFTGIGEEMVRTISSSCFLEKNETQDYFNVQHPTNLRMPVYRKELINKLSNDKENLHKIRKEYCSAFDFIDFILRILK